jgi:pimeloyl-ACP methyl ester carboxylesterase
MRVDEHGSVGPLVVAIHGGPGAPGSITPVARYLGARFRVLEPWQRPSGAEPLTVARHVDDFRALLDERAPGTRPALVGASWGAMLALALAAEVPERVGPIVLVGSGTFDLVARERFKQLRAERPGGGYDFDPIEPPTPVDFDARANDETWRDYLRCEAAGLYPPRFAAIRSPVLMLHGAYDPHPGALIRQSLLPHLPHLEYVEIERTGHEPWRERHGRDPFFETLVTWLANSLRPYQR